MLKHGDRIAVAVSGGKDSLSLLQVLSEISVDHGSTLSAVMVDEGIEGYRDEAVALTKTFTSSIGVELRILSFRELFGHPLDDALRLRGNRKVSSCSICGVLRRRAIDMAARQVGANVIATGHNLDDILQTFLINQLNGDLERIRWIHPAYTGASEFGLRRIKPFAELYEVEIAFYAFLQDLTFQGVRCPHSDEGIRSEIRNFLNALETKHPGVKYSMLRSALGIAQDLPLHEKEVRRCPSCGNPCSGSICSVCRTLTLLSPEATPAGLREQAAPL